MIWVIAWGPGHHHSAVWCGPRNQPCLRSKEQSGPQGSGQEEYWEGGSCRKRQWEGEWPKCQFPEKNWLDNLWSLQQSENPGSCVKTAENLKVEQQNTKRSMDSKHEQYRGPGRHCWPLVLFGGKPQTCRTQEAKTAATSFPSSDGKIPGSLLASYLVIPYCIYSVFSSSDKRHWSIQSWGTRPILYNSYVGSLYSGRDQFIITPQVLIPTCMSPKFSE